MSWMIKCRQIRIYPNKTQEKTINQTLGACRWVYNQYIEYNKRIYEDENRFLSGYDFSKILTTLKKEEERFTWLNSCSSKALKDSIMRAERAYKDFFKKKTQRPPKFRSKKDKFQSYYFIKDGIQFKHNKVKIPILGWVSFREKHYRLDKSKISGGRIIKDGDVYAVSFTYHVDDVSNDIERTSGLGIDVGVKHYAVIASKHNIRRIENINKTNTVIELEERIKKLQRIISNKIEINKKLKRKEVYKTSRIQKLRKKIRKSQARLNNIRKDFINKLCYSLVIAKPKYITVEDLSIQNMLQNSGRILADNLAKCKLFYFKTQLTNKCHEHHIELRQANKYFASSKTCSCCCHKKKSLSLSDRLYICDECGFEIDRDVNAAINLRKLKKYTIL